MVSPREIENLSRCTACTVMVMLVALFCGGLIIRPVPHDYGRPTTWRDNVPCPDINEPIDTNKLKDLPKLGPVNEYNLNKWDIEHGLGECCYRALPHGDIHNRATLAPDWERILKDRNPYWLEYWYGDWQTLLKRS